ncbi:hypothetical protein QYE76_057391 [Lolium multiflorum]|uniref:F-box domain-containing protein n=1 Tax=Lolium multiflorum TaxID=4521 RepID=A0AAD8WNR3_LOLMU|nr:hypothetical protein QYE76_057391 [Lolium multiflorum]
MAKGRRSKRRRCPASSLTDDLVVEILSRLPARSVCRFKCVSATWRDLISHAVHRMKLPQTLAGFFTMHDGEMWSVPHFTNVSGTGPPLVSDSIDFLPIHKRTFILDSCNSLLLYKCSPILDMTDSHYFVCNPTTKEWAALPDSNLGHKGRALCLGFDPAVSSHFYVYEFFEDYVCFPQSVPSVRGVEVYSSETGERVHREDNAIIPLGYRSPSVFLNGCLHYLTYNDPAIAVLDTQGKPCRSIPVPDNEDYGFIQQSQGRLHYANFEADDEDKLTRLVVYVLEDHESQRWKLKHTAEASSVLDYTRSYLVREDFEWVAIHPDCNTIFYTVEPDKTLMSYDMDCQQVQVICTLGADTREKYFPYVPLFSELQALHI